MFKSGLSLVFLISVLDFALSLSDEHKASIQSAFVSAGQKCITDNPITEEDIAAFKDRKFPDGQNAACFSACVLTEVGITDDKGTLLKQSALERAKAVFKEEEEIKTVEEFFDICTKDLQAEEDRCDRAKELFKCSMENAEKFGF